MVKEVISGKIRRYFVLNKYENEACQHVWQITNAMLGETFIAWNACIQKEKGFQNKASLVTEQLNWWLKHHVLCWGVFEFEFLNAESAEGHDSGDG